MITLSLYFIAAVTYWDAWWPGLMGDTPPPIRFLIGFWFVISVIADVLYSKEITRSITR